MLVPWMCTFILAVGFIVLVGKCIYFWYSLFLKNWYLRLWKFQIPSIHILKYTAQVLGVILALLDDPDESVQLTAVSCLLMVRLFLLCVCLYILLSTRTSVLGYFLLACPRSLSLHLKMQLSPFCLIFQYGFGTSKCVILLFDVSLEFLFFFDPT